VEGRRRSEHNTGGGEQRERRQSTADGRPRTDREFPPPVPAEGEQMQTLTVPSDLVGCIIGRGMFLALTLTPRELPNRSSPTCPGGAQIANIRRESQARISISREPIGSGRERLFTISGRPEANTRALELIYSALEHEKERRALAE
jgi:heterogeneous nuclear rnp K-like protein 2